MHIPSGTVIDFAFQYGMDETLQGQIKYSYLLIVIFAHSPVGCICLHTFVDSPKPLGKDIPSIYYKNLYLSQCNTF